MAVEVGQVLDGKYRIIRLIGKGGMGAVYEAEHLLIDRRVAVKELHAEALAAENAVTRFEREARAAGRIGSEHVLQIFDVGTLPDGSRFMVSELLDGETLAARLHRVNRIGPRELVPIAEQLLTGLAAAHDAGVLHRDLKPDNIFLVRSKAGVTDFVKIIDFGIAKFQQANQEEALKMTKTGMVVGTPYYLSPEQARGTGEADARSDLYSVGVILYECVTGEVPFNALNFNDLIFKIVLETPRSPMERANGVDQRFSDIILKAMARDPLARFQSARELLSTLADWAGNAPAHASSQPAVQAFGGTAQIPGQWAAPEFRISPAAQVFTPAFVPTPSSFGATRNPQLSADAPTRKSSALPVVLAVGGSLLLLIGVAVGVVRLLHHTSPPAIDSASAAPAPLASLAMSAPSPAQPAPEIPVKDALKPSVEPAPEPAGTTSTQPPLEQSATKAKLANTASRLPAHAHPATPVPPAPHAASAQPKRRDDWGY